MDRKQQLKLLKQYISDKQRIKHSIGTEKMAVRLAKKHGANQEKAAVAGLLHDIGKNLPRDMQQRLIKQNGMVIRPVEALGIEILHGHFGAMILKKNGICDESILNAVKYHTVAAKKMTKLDKIIYLADVTEPSRSFRGISKLRKLSKKNLDDAMLWALSLTMKSVLKRKRILHPNSVKAYNRLIISKTNKK